jgi:hypothetical protein
MPIRHEPVALMLSRQALPTLDRSRYGSAAGVARAPTCWPTLWVPGILHTSRDLLILVNQPAEPVASSNPSGLGHSLLGKGS